ncbi:histidine triad nucleotide-binding protein [Campylobacter pinnipediorum]|uniref:Histidine triad nucleotide-binding protein n=1 Tax=Campylobacter pinnipediorum subsp. pinnipediorum TaxID=1660067 RepID=A0AAX0LAR6_9BACT|nr:histidine triad nucleotide-binding protein [Campylobacter pinnipediorum]AQW81068.1 PKCI-related HIT family hydrolase [Campylobacter pinnipediorum subsp. pinnipediorum]AQW82686.1 PKCI-related HIT family hydrolase [Campylobacter pinnipediorum subsp. pinnipediorum]OPA77181.1 histidine triad nucleotide-binding protein [Campylobacter pinnipediorum subsp. pinnipediorum]OPA78967.1 histidine triad nucleotide-binding protein [Campylobacter pinnipediorum subsp. pinnipediorum]
MTIFEKIVAGEIPCNKVLENDKFLAFRDINPKAPIHILIIPKKHYKNIQEMDPALMGEMLSFIQELARFIGVDESGYRLVTNCGENGGQEVMHLHFHMLAGAKLYWDKNPSNPQSTF